MSGPDWRHGRLAIVVTFDEGDPVNRVPFVLIARECPAPSCPSRPITTH